MQGCSHRGVLCGEALVQLVQVDCRRTFAHVAYVLPRAALCMPPWVASRRCAFSVLFPPISTMLNACKASSTWCCRTPFRLPIFLGQGVIQGVQSLLLGDLCQSFLSHPFICFCPLLFLLSVVILVFLSSSRSQARTHKRKEGTFLTIKFFA